MLFLLGCSGFSTSVHPTRFANLPEFDDYRKAGVVIEGYSQNRDLSTLGVTLRLRQAVTRTLAAGTVHKIGKLRGYGRYVIVDHGHGWHSLYSNLSRVEVTVGESISRGQALGLSRHKRLFLVVSFRGNPINPSEVVQSGTRQLS